jgi:hypothetical protein
VSAAAHEYEAALAADPLDLETAREHEAFRRETGG